MPPSGPAASRSDCPTAHRVRAVTCCRSLGPAGLRRSPSPWPSSDPPGGLPGVGLLPVRGTRDALRAASLRPGQLAALWLLVGFGVGALPGRPPARRSSTARGSGPTPPQASEPRLPPTSSPDLPGPSGDAGADSSELQSRVPLTALRRTAAGWRSMLVQGAPSARPTRRRRAQGPSSSCRAAEYAACPALPTPFSTPPTNFFPFFGRGFLSSSADADGKCLTRRDNSAEMRSCEPSAACIPAG